jgi:REP element-mobilizing transposase RayT
MTRLARVVAVGLPHHVTQRGNARQYILRSDADRTVYLDLLRQNIEQQNLALIGYCLMSNHVHLITVPPKANVLGLALKDTHGRYASYWNAIHHSSGHVWQGRYYSCPLDETHLWKACAIQSSIRCGRVWWPRLSLGRGPAPQPIAPSFQPMGTWPWSTGKLAGRLAAGADISPQEKTNPN